MNEHVAGRPISRSTYVKHKCRCDGCKDDNDAYIQAYRYQQLVCGTGEWSCGRCHARFDSERGLSVHVTLVHSSEGDAFMSANNDDTTWMRWAECRKHPTAMFFPNEGLDANNAHLKKAIEICQTCPVAKACLEYAVDNHIDDGVWGGKSERQRVLIRRHRKAARTKAA